MKTLDDFKGVICYLIKVEDSFMFIQSVELDNNEKLLFNCMVLTKDEKGNPYYANASYSANEIVLTDTKIQDLIKERQMKEGTQLSLF